MSDIVESILRERYYHDGESSWEDIVNRVVEHVMGDSEYKEDARRYMLEKKFIPNSPTLMNAGNDMGQLSACISGDTLVYTYDGMKQMCDVEIGDLVLTHKNRFKRVTNKWNKGVKETIKITFGSNNRRKFNLTCTPDHKILNCENEWVESQYIVNAKVPSMWVSNEHFIDKIDMVAHNSVYDRDLEIVDHKLKVLNKNTKNRSGKYDKRINDVNNIVENDVEMAEFFGEYLANGNIDGNNTVRITINSDKIDKINTIKNIVDSHFGIECCIQNSNHGNWVTIRIESPLIVNMIVGIFGKTFYNKRLPKWIANAPHDYKEALFNGIMSDGHTFENGSKNIVLANPTLVYETMLLGRELGYKANFTSDCMNKLSKSPTSKAIFGDVSYINNVVKEENIPLEVFDIEVEDDHSFVAGDFIVHNCFVLPIDDDMASIGETLKNAMLVHKSGGGTGFNFGNLRPKGALIESTKGESSGPISFMKVYNSATNAVLQGGKRRGANMGILPVWHDDVEEFIDCKKVEGEIANFNISVMIDDDFMKSALCSELYNGKDADAILNHIAQNAWNNGEPGIVFYDTINADNSNSHLGVIDGCNPCSEQPLMSNESCTLASIDISKFVNSEGVFLQEDFEDCVKVATIFLNYVLDANKYPIPEIEEMSLKTRKIGLGLMGFADALIKSRIVYGSPESIELAEEWSAILYERALDTSMMLAEIDGVYPAWEGSEWSKVDVKVRNSALTCYAPTGCQKADTLIVTDDGILKLCELGDVDGDQWQDVDTTVTTDIGSKKCNAFYVNGVKPTKKILLKTGIELESTLDHKYRVFNENDEYVWKCAKDLKVADRMAVYIGGYNKETNSDLIITPEVNKYCTDIIFQTEMDEKLAWLLGVMHGDGSVHDKGIRIHCNRKDIELKNKIVGVIYDLFNYNATIYSERTCDSIYINSKAILRWMELNGMLKQKSLYVDIPKVVRTSSKDVIKSFIDGYWEADGSQSNGSYYIDTVSYDMSQTLSVCARAIGINTNIYKYTFENDKSHKGKNPKYRIYFLKFPKQGVDLKSIKVSVEKKNKYKLASLIDEHMYIDYVEEITDSECATFDISVPDNNTYIANSAISHNTISQIAECSSGIEPNFSYVYDRYVLIDNERVKFRVIHPIFDSYVMKWYDDRYDDIMDYVYTNGTITGCPDMDEDDIALFKTSRDLTPKQHIDIQAAFQINCDAAISKTINCDNRVTVEDVKELIIYAWKSGCKGLTVYRDGSREMQVISTAESKPVDIGRPPELFGITYKRRSGCGKLFVTVNERNGEPYEVFVQTSGHGGCAANSEALGRMISIGLRNGVSAWEIKKQLSRVKCNRCNNGNTDGKSCADIIGKCLYPDMVREKTVKKEDHKSSIYSKCPFCGEIAYVNVEGCGYCTKCGESKCQ